MSLIFILFWALSLNGYSALSSGLTFKSLVSSRTGLCFFILHALMSSQKARRLFYISPNNPLSYSWPFSHSCLRRAEIGAREIGAWHPSRLDY